MRIPTGTLLNDPSATPSTSVDPGKRRLRLLRTQRLLMLTLTLIDDELNHEVMWRYRETVDDGWYG
jgi:hypothetical protein